MHCGHCRLDLVAPDGAGHAQLFALHVGAPPPRGAKRKGGGGRALHCQRLARGYTCVVRVPCIRRHVVTYMVHTLVPAVLPVLVHMLVLPCSTRLRLRIDVGNVAHANVMQGGESYQGPHGLRCR